MGSGACAHVNPRYRAYVLAQGFCGLRPGEADTLRRRDIVLDSSPPTIIVRGSISRVPERFFADGESRRRPLKRRGGKASRTIPVPAELVPVLRWHLDTFVAPGRDALVFTNTKGRQIIQSNFTRDVWKKARAAAFEPDSALRGVRRHDLRHSAITLWLNSGVPLKTAQRWSGHKTLSVLLNTYLGVMRTDEDVAVERIEAALAEPGGQTNEAGGEGTEDAPDGRGERRQGGEPDGVRWQARDIAHGQQQGKADGNGDD